MTSVGTLVGGLFLFLNLFISIAYGEEYFSPVEELLPQEMARPMSTISDSTWEELQGKQFLLVTGFMSEFASITGGYYKSALEVANEEFKMDAQIMRPLSRNSVEANSKRLYEKILKLYTSTGKSIILVCHSKAGSECYQTVVGDYPELVLKGIVSKTILLMPSLYGSPLAAQRSIPLFLISILLGKGLQSLDPSKSELRMKTADEKFVNYLIKMYGAGGEEGVLEKVAEVSDQMPYLLGYADKGEESPAVKIVQAACGGDLHAYGPNDGLLLLEDQKPRSLGYNIGTLRGAHTKWVVDGKMGGGEREEQKAFFRAVIQASFQKRPKKEIEAQRAQEWLLNHFSPAMPVSKL